jgi:predicted component of type VI protein secretion system
MIFNLYDTENRVSFLPIAHDDLIDMVRNRSFRLRVRRTLPIAVRSVPSLGVFTHRYSQRYYSRCFNHPPSPTTLRTLTVMVKRLRILVDRSDRSQTVPVPTLTLSLHSTDVTFRFGENFIPPFFSMCHSPTSDIILTSRRLQWR